jgi:hypothetical protein
MASKLNFVLIKDYMSQMGYTVLWHSPTYKDRHDKLQVCCPKGHISSTTWFLFRYRKTRCAHCYQEKMKTTVHTAEQQLLQSGYTLISHHSSYQNRFTKITVKCPKGHTYDTSWTNFRTGSRCAICNTYKTFKKQAQLVAVLDKLYPSEERVDQARPDWLINPKTGRRLELDCYYPGLGMAFEYNGQQHYTTISVFQQDENKLRLQQERDQIKQSLCRNKGTILVIVKYSNSLTIQSVRRLIRQAKEMQCPK